MNNFLVDSHCHLNMINEDCETPLEDIIKRALDNNVLIMNNIATEVYEFSPAINIAEKYKNVYTSLGVHPAESEKNKLTVEELTKYTKHPKVIGVGEAGLEYYYDPIDKKIQKSMFEIHIEVARKEKLPLIIHSRNADEDMIDMLEGEMKNGEFKFLLHCFSSGESLFKKGLDLGGYISLSGIITFKNAESLRNIIKDIPLNRFLIETDSPYLAPVPFRGKKNEPSFVKNTAEFLGDFLGIGFDNIAKHSTENFLKLFNKVNFSINS